MASSQPTRTASPSRAGERPLGDGRRPRSGSRAAVDRRHRERRRRRRARADRRARAGRSRSRPHRAPSSAAARSPATIESRPSAARSAPTIAAPSVATPSIAMSNVAMGLTRSTPEHGRQVVRDALRPRPIGRIEVTTTSPGTTSSTQALAAARACWPTLPRATTRARPTVSAPIVRVARPRSRTRRRPGEPLLEPEREAERQPAEPGERRDQERDEQRRHEQDRIDRQRPARRRQTPLAPPVHGQRTSPIAGDDDEHDVPASGPGRRADRDSIDLRLKRLDRRDAGRPAGRFERGRHRHDDARRRPRRQRRPAGRVGVSSVTDPTVRR